MNFSDSHMSTYKGCCLNITIFEITTGQWVIGVSVDGKHMPTSLRPFTSRLAVKSWEKINGSALTLH
jgi:hypothetical protein